MTTGFDHKQFYAARVEDYNKRDFLCKPEEVITQRFDSIWGDTVFLDLGVGAGRTTKFFAPNVKEYIGVDLSEAMIQACRDKFSSYYDNCRFLVSDVRNISTLHSDSVDFVLFSYNGLSDLELKGVNETILEVARVLKPGGYFFFSLLNILWLSKFFSFRRLRRNPIKLCREWWLVSTFRKRNPNWKNLPFEKYALVHHYKYDMNKPTLFVNPFWQVEYLSQYAFSEVEVLLNSNGAVVTQRNKSSLEHEHFVYYLCRLGSP